MTFPTPETIRSVQCGLLKLMEAMRPVVLVDEAGVEIQAREGVAQVGLDMPLGHAVDKRQTKFYVRHGRLREAPAVGAIFAVKGRTERWRLRQIETGLAQLDPLWTLACEEEEP